MIRPSRAHAKITGSGRKFDRTTVWTMVWRWSDQRSIWSEKSDHRRIRAQLGLIITSSSALRSDQKRFRTPLAQIRDHFERIMFFSFFCFFSQMLALPRGSHKEAFWSKPHLKSDSSDQKKGVQLIAEAGPLQNKFWSIGDHDVSYGKLTKFIHGVRNIN